MTKLIIEIPDEAPTHVSEMIKNIGGRVLTDHSHLTQIENDGLI